MYELRYTSAAQRYFKKIKEKGLKKAFQEALCSIAENPFCGSAKVGDLTGIYGYDVYYNRPIIQPLAYHLLHRCDTLFHNWSGYNRHHIQDRKSVV